jgi:putative colanic acid biosynthesis glycosyltransferase WcaI
MNAEIRRMAIANVAVAKTKDVVGRRPQASQLKPRVMIYGINYGPEPIGVGRYTGELGAYLDQQGVQIEVITAVPHYPGWALRNGYRNRYKKEIVSGQRIFRCPLLLKSQIAGVWRLAAPLSFALTSAPVAIWRILWTRPATVVCVEPTLLCAPAALLAAKLVGAKTVLHVQDLEADAAFAVGHLSGGALRMATRVFERLMLRSFDVVVTISDRMRQRLAEKGIERGRLRVVRNWVDLDKISPLSTPSGFRRELGFVDGDFVVLYAGNIGPKQSLGIMLDAAAALADRKNLFFVVAGDGPEKRNLLKTYRHLPNVRFLPVQPEERLCELLNCADVHLLPQQDGTADLVLPSKLGGMLASGRPSIVMAEPGTELFEFLGDGAILLPPGDRVALVRTLKSLSDGVCPVTLGSNRDRIATLDARQNLSTLAAILVGTQE